MIYINPQNITVTRRIQSASGGHLSVTNSTSSTVRADVQPANGRDILSLPELERTKRVIKLYCSRDVDIRCAEDGHPADLITYDGETFVVRKIRDYDDAEIEHLKILAVRTDE